MSMHKGLIGRSEGGASVKDDELLVQCMNSGQMDAFQIAGEKTLADYIARKTRNDAFNSVKHESKLTFEEWFNSRCGGDTYTQQEDIKSRMQWAWEAAQENK